MRQMFVAVVLLVGAACGEKKSEPEKTAPTLTNAQPSDPSPAGRAAENPTAAADKPTEAKPKEPSPSQVARDREAIRRKIKARIDQMAPPVDQKFSSSRAK